MSADDNPEVPLASSPRERRERMRGEMTAAILEAARRVMQERGVAGLSLREVARRVQLQVSSLYEYYPNKHALYEALFLLAVRHYHAHKTQELAAASPAFWDQIAAHLSAYMTFAHQYPELYQLAFERPVPGFVPSEESMAESAWMLGELEQWLEAAQAAGWIRADIPVSDVRDLLIAVMHGLTSQQVANDPSSPPGTGRFGHLIPRAVAMMRAALEPPSGHESIDDQSPEPTITEERRDEASTL